MGLFQTPGRFPKPCLSFRLVGLLYTYFSLNPKTGRQTITLKPKIIASRNQKDNQKETSKKIIFHKKAFKTLDFVVDFPFFFKIKKT